MLPELACEWDVRRGAEQLHDVFRAVGLTREQFESRDFTWLRQIEHLLRSGRIAESFYWRNGDG